MYVHTGTSAVPYMNFYQEMFFSDAGENIFGFDHRVETDSYMYGRYTVARM